MSGRTLVFAVGIPTHLDPAIPEATFADADAAAFAEAWRAAGAEAEEVVALLGAEATFATVRSRVKRLLKNAAAGDRVVCFYAGQGITIDGATYLALYDTQADDVEATDISLSFLLTTLAGAKAGRTILFLDMARGGFAVDGAELDLDGEPAAGELRDFCEEGSSRVAFVSCSPGERSHTSRELGHGLWTSSLVQALRGFSYCEVIIDTGRTHQIRVHAQHLGLPVAGDDKYGDAETNRRLKELGLRRLFLHAARLEFDLGELGDYSFSAPLPRELSEVLERLGS